MILDGVPESIRLDRLPGLNARALAVLAGPGGGKTRALGELLLAEGVAVLALDPAGELAELAAGRSGVDVLRVPVDWAGRPGLLGWVVGRLRAGGRVVLDLSATYRLAGEVVEPVLGAVREAGIRDLLLIGEEAQRYVGQSRDGFSYAFLAAVEMGRNWRWGRVVASQRPADVDKRILARCDTVLLGRVQHPRDVEAYDEMLALNVPDRREREGILRGMLNLKPGHFLFREPAHAPGVNR